MRSSSLQWGVGGYCLLLGALMLVAPHRFLSAPFAAFQSQLVWWGGLFLLSGMGLVSTGVLPSRARAIVPVHAVAGLALLLFSLGFVASRHWVGASTLGVLGLGTALAPLLERRASRRARPGDPLPRLVAASAILNGLALLAFPAELAAPLYGLVHSMLPVFGLVFLTTGIWLGYVQLHPASSRMMIWSAHLLVAGAYFAFLAAAVLPFRVWTGILYYGGFGALLALQPWLEPRLQRVDPTALRTRLALALAATAALPIILAAVVFSTRGAQVAVTEALTNQQALAGALARDVAHDLVLHRAAVAALAAEPGFLDLPRAHLAAHIAADAGLEAGGLAYIVDAQGRVIIHPDASLVASGTDLSGTLPVAALLASEATSGTFRYGSSADEQFAAFARVPEINWGVIVEQPAALVLADTRASGEFTFELLLLAVAAAAALGVGLANWLTSPLRALAEAVQALDAGDAGAPLPTSGLSELEHLAATFGDLREHLAARTAERARAEATLQRWARALQALHDVAVATSGVLDPDALARLVVTHARDLLKTDSAAIFWSDGSAGALRPLASSHSDTTVMRQIATPGVGIAGRAFQMGQPVTVEDYPKWEFATSWALEAGVKSGVAVPLLAHNRVLGSLALRSDTPRRFLPEQVQLLALLASQVGPALEGARLFADSEQRRLEAEALADLARRGATERDSKQVISLICAQACQLVRANFAGVFLLAQDGTLRCGGIFGNNSDTWPSWTGPMRPSPAGWAISSGQTVVVERLGENEHFPLADLPGLRGEGGRAVVAAPLQGHGEAMGALLVGWRVDTRPTNEQVRLAEALAGYAATILDNARAHSKLVVRAEELATSEARLRTLYEAVACGVLVRDQTGTIVQANAAAEEILGLSVSEMLGRTSAVLWRSLREDGAVLPDDESPNRTALRTGRPVRNQTLCVQRLDGTRRWLQLDAVPLPGDQGEPMEVVTSFIDISERKGIEERLRAANQRLAAASARARTLAEEARTAEARFRGLVESAPDAIVAIDDTGRIALVNTQAEALFGFQREELFGQSIQLLLPADSYESKAVPRAGGEAATNGHVRRGLEVRGRRKDGSGFPADISLSPLRTDDGLLIISVIHDLTERQEMEEQLIRAQRLEMAGRIAGQVAHDFNNLLAPLAGYPELIKLRLPEDHPAIEFCDSMLQAAQQMAEINTELLTLARRGHSTHEPADLSRVLEQAIRQLEERPESLALVQETADNLLLIRGSEAQLLRVVTNLLSNAREAMQDSGVLTVKTENVYVDQPFGRHNRVDVGEYVRLEVSDTGEGIPEDIRDQIFEAFFTTKRAAGRYGTGLGLSVVQAIVADHHGYVDVQSQVGRGTTFSVYLPASRDPLPKEDGTAVPTGGEKILVVDDDPGQRAVAKDLLETLGPTA